MKTFFAILSILGSATLALADGPEVSPSVVPAPPPPPAPLPAPSPSAAGPGGPEILPPDLSLASASSASSVGPEPAPSVAQPGPSPSVPTAPAGSPGPEDVQISPNNPAAVNLAAVLAGLIISPDGLLIGNRSKGLPPAGSSSMTVFVQKKDDIKQIGEYNIDLKNATAVYCPEATDDYTHSWPCAFTEGLKQAGWDIGSPLGVPDALQALSGHTATDKYNASRDDPKSLNEGALWNLSDPKKSPWILGTKSEDVAVGVKGNYAYAMSLATPEDSVLYKSSNPIKLNDPAIEDNNILISFDDLRKSASAIWGFAADAA